MLMSGGGGRLMLMSGGGGGLMLMSGGGGSLMLMSGGGGNLMLMSGGGGGLMLMSGGGGGLMLMSGGGGGLMLMSGGGGGLMLMSGGGGGLMLMSGGGGNLMLMSGGGGGLLLLGGVGGRACIGRCVSGVVALISGTCLGRPVEGGCMVHWVVCGVGCWVLWVRCGGRLMLMSGVGSNWGMWGTGVGRRIRLCAFVGVVSRGRVIFMRGWAPFGVWGLVEGSVCMGGGSCSCCLCSVLSYGCGGAVLL